MNIRAKVRVPLSLLKETLQEWDRDNASRLAAALAFYTALSLAPMLIIMVAVASLAFQAPEVREQVIGQSQGLIGPKGAAAIQTIFSSARANLSLATIIGLATLLFSSTFAFVELQDALNTVWQVAPRPGAAIKRFFRKRLLSFCLLLGLGLLLLASVLTSTVLAAVLHFVGNLLPFPSVLLYLLNSVTSFVVATVVFAVIYKVLPDVKSSWSDVWIGAAVTSFLFTVGKILIGVYLGNTSIGSAYGAAGSFVVLLIWIYYSAQIFFFGAEFTQVYSRRYGSHIVPDADSVRFQRIVETQDHDAHYQAHS